MAQTRTKRANAHRPEDPTRLDFSKQRLEAEEPQERRRWVYDNVTEGLGLQITPTGHKSFYFAKRINGRYRKIKLGNFPGISVERARELARRHNGDVAKGENPADARQQARAAMTFGELFDLYLEKYAKLHKRTWRYDQEVYQRHLKRWSGRRMDSITRADIQQLHGKIGQDRPTMANRVLALLSKVYNFAIATGCEVSNPVTGLKRFKEASRERFMDADEMRRFLQAIKKEENETHRDYLKVLLFTGARRRNVAAMRWDEVDMRRKVWTIPAEKFKTGQALEVPLVPEVMKILKARQKVNKKRNEPSDYVFPSRNRNPKTPYLDDPRKAFDRVCKKAEISGLTLHDLRRTVASWATKEGVPYPVVGRMIGHSVDGVTAIYARTDLEAVREGFERTVKAMSSAGNVR